MKQEQVLLLKQLQEIIQKVKPETKINLARLKTLSAMMLAIISLQTVNLTRLSVWLRTGNQISKYKRLQRFMSYNWDQELIAGLAYGLYCQFSGTNQVRLSMDRTSWQLGKETVNILLIGIVYNKSCLPLYWSLLDKKGNSSSQERIELVKKVLKIIPACSIQTLFGDREFIGKDWIKWLMEEKIPFIIRIKKNQKAGERQVKELFRGGQTVHYQTIMEAKLWICGKVLANENGKSDFVITVSNISKIDYLGEYSHRWNIECLFKSLKSKGFDLETTHLTKPDKISNLISILALSYTWCCITGEILNETEPIKTKTHTRKSVSLFRYGLDYLKNVILNFVDYRAEYRQVLKFLWCT